MSPSSARRPVAGILGVSAGVLAILFPTLLQPGGAGLVRGQTTTGHLVVSEIVTGGTSASDEMIELHNPTPVALPLEGLELIYVTATGVSVSRRATWELGAPYVPAGGHVLIANEAGRYAGIADAVYMSGMAATGGSVVLRIVGATSAIDALSWGTATNAWLEGRAVPAPAAGASVERRPGGDAGSWQDTDDNVRDFVERAVPDPQNLASPPSTARPPTPVPTGSGPPAPSADPTAVASPSPSTPLPSSTTAPSPGPTVVPIAVARGAPEGSVTTIEGVALTDSGFADGGGYVADGSGGVAVLLTSGSFERAARIRITGAVDDRFAQRTLRADATGMTIVGPGAEPTPTKAPTGAVGEAHEGTLVTVRGTVRGAPAKLSAGVAYELDDGSGAVRVLVATAAGIETAAWTRGAVVEVTGVVGQRDSGGTGTTGYRLQPRDPADVSSVTQPTPTPSGDPSSSDPPPTPQADGAISIAEARELPRNATVTVRGTLTLVPGVVDPASAALQDGSGAILLRLPQALPRLALGDRVEVTGTRSTFQGMETLRVAQAPRALGSGRSPAPRAIRTADAGEGLEARLVKVRGALVAGARRAGTGSLSFELDDGSGPLRVYVGAALGVGPERLVAGAWVEVTGVLGQETTGALPLRGYRVWPRRSTEVRITAAPPDGRNADGGNVDGESDGWDVGSDATAAPEASLADIDSPDLATLGVGATLVAGAWPELELGALLWDGERIAALDETSGPAVDALVAVDRRLPLAVELRGLSARGAHRDLGIPVLGFHRHSGGVIPRPGAPPDPPVAELPEAGAAWVSLVGHLAGGSASPRLIVTDAPSVSLDVRCHAADGHLSGSVRVTGIGLAAPGRVLVPCDGIRPAPRLAASARLSSVPADGGQRAGSTDVIEPSATSPWLPAGLLAAGAMVLLVAAIVGRRLGRHSTPDGTVIEDEDDGEGPREPRGDDDATMPGRLELIPVRRDRGSA